MCIRIFKYQIIYIYIYSLKKTLNLTLKVKPNKDKDWYWKCLYEYYSKEIKLLTIFFIN